MQYFIFKKGWGAPGGWSAPAGPAPPAWNGGGGQPGPGYQVIYQFPKRRNIF